MVRGIINKKRGQQMKRMKIDFDKAKQLLEDKPNLTEEEYNRRFWELWYETEEEIERWKNLIWHM